MSVQSCVCCMAWMSVRLLATPRLWCRPVQLKVFRRCWWWWNNIFRCIFHDYRPSKPMNEWKQNQEMRAGCGNLVYFYWIGYFHDIAIVAFGRNGQTLSVRDTIELQFTTNSQSYCRMICTNLGRSAIDATADQVRWLMVRRWFTTKRFIWLETRPVARFNAISIIESPPIQRSHIHTYPLTLLIAPKRIWIQWRSIDS